MQHMVCESCEMDGLLERERARWAEVNDWDSERDAREKRREPMTKCVFVCIACVGGISW